MAAEDRPLTSKEKQFATYQGIVVRGENVQRPLDILADH